LGSGSTVSDKSDSVSTIYDSFRIGIVRYNDKLNEKVTPVLQITFCKDNFLPVCCL